MRREHHARTVARQQVIVQRVEAIGQGIEKYNVVHGTLPQQLSDLAPHYVSASLLHDPWSNPYKYLKRPERYLVIGFTSDGKADPDLFLSRAIGAPSVAPVTLVPETGGISLVE